MKTIIVAKAVVQNDRGAVLLLRRSATDPRRPGEWDFPGGGVEPGEEIVAGVAREIAEEAGLTIAPEHLSLLYAATEPYEPSDESVTRLLFSCKTANENVELSFEHDQFKWVDIDMALEQFPHPFYSVGLEYARTNDLLG